MICFIFIVFYFKHSISSVVRSFSQDTHCDYEGKEINCTFSGIVQAIIKGGRDTITLEFENGDKTETKNIYVQLEMNLNDDEKNVFDSKEDTFVLLFLL